MDTKRRSFLRRAVGVLLAPLGVGLGFEASTAITPPDIYCIITWEDDTQLFLTKKQYLELSWSDPPRPYLRRVRDE